MLTLQIHAPGEHLRSLVYRNLQDNFQRHPYSKGHDQENLYLDLRESEEPRLLLVELNLLEGVRASVLGERNQFEESPEAPISH